MESSPKISLKKASFSEIEFLWYLRNQPDVYKYSRVNRAVGWKEHINWILPVLLEINNKELFIIQNLEKPIGQIRFDYDNQKEAEVSISILKEFQGKGIATRSLDLAIKKIKKEKKAKLLIAEIHKKNLSSIRLFEKLNFKFKEKKGNWQQYILEL